MWSPTLRTLCPRAKNADTTSYPFNSIFSPIGIWGSSCVVFTDTIIPYTSNHPTQHKYAAVKFLYNRLNTYDLQGDEYRREENIIHNIVHNNSYPIHPQKPHNPKPRKHQPNTQVTSRKWATFTYVGKETSFITNTFRRTNFKIALRTVNTIHNALIRKNQTRDKYTRSGVYELTCPNCKKAYVGQTGSSFTTRFQEHKNAFKNNSHSSKYAKHLTEQNHTINSIQNTMQMLQYQNKGAHLNTYERFHIYTEYINKNHLNNEHTIFPNKLFDTLLKPHNPYKNPTHLAHTHTTTTTTTLRPIRQTQL